MEQYSKKDIVPIFYKIKVKNMNKNNKRSEKYVAEKLTHKEKLKTRFYK